MALLGASPVFAQSSWNVSTGGNWDTVTNWDTNPTIPNAISATANIQNLTAAGAYDISASTAQTFTVGTLNLGTATASTNDVDLSLNANAGLVMDVSSGSAAINLFTVNNAGSSLTINSAIQLNDNTTISLTRQTTQIHPLFTGAINLQTNALTFGGTRSANIRMTGLISGSGGSLSMAAPGSERQVALENTGSTFSGGATITGLNLLVLGDGTNSFTGTGGGGIAGTGTLTFSETSRGTPLGGTRSPQIYLNGSNSVSPLTNNTAGNVLANSIGIAAGNYGIFTIQRSANLSGALTGSGTLFQIAGGGGTSSEKSLALAASQTGFTGTYVLRETQLVTRGNDFGSGAKLQLNSTNTNGGTALVGVTAATGTAAFSALLDVVNNGNAVFIQTGGGTTFQLTGNFSNSGASAVAVTASAGSGNTIINGVSDTSNLRVGMTITGTGIAANTVIQGIGASSVQISNSTTGSVTGFTQSAGTAGTITFTRGDGTGSGGYTVGSGGTAAFELSGTGSLNNPIVVAGGANPTALRFTNTSGTQTFTGIVSGSGAITRNGTGGTTILSGINTYSGTTTVTAGTLLVNGTHGAASTVGSYTVNGGTLGGTGTIKAGSAALDAITVSSGGVISAGSAGIGTLTLDGGSTTGSILNMGTGTSFSFDLGAANTSDLVRFFNYTGSSDFVRTGTVTLNFTGAQDGTYTLFTFFSDAGTSVVASSISSGLTLGAGLSGFTSTLNYNTNDISLTLSSIPEPSTYAAFAGLGVLSLAALRRRRSV